LSRDSELTVRTVKTINTETASVRVSVSGIYRTSQERRAELDRNLPARACITSAANLMSSPELYFPERAYQAK
jgi:hypothetical protein